MTRKMAKLAVVLGTAAALGLSACGGGGNEPAASSDPGEASGIVNLLGPEDPATFAPLIEKFEAANPDITIEYTQVPFDQINSTLEQRLGAKDTSIDVYAVDQPRVAQLAAKGYLEDLSDLSEQAKAATTESQYAINVYQDKLWSLPIWNSTQLMFVNLDALEAAGITPPSQDPAER